MFVLYRFDKDMELIFLVVIFLILVKISKLSLFWGELRIWKCWIFFIFFVVILNDLLVGFIIRILFRWELLFCGVYLLFKLNGSLFLVVYKILLFGNIFNVFLWWCWVCVLKEVIVFGLESFFLLNWYLYIIW